MSARPFTGIFLAALLTAGPIVSGAWESASGVVVERTSASDLTLEIARPFESARLVIRRIGGEVVHRATYTAAPIPLFPRLDDDGEPLTDGTYVWELRVQPDVDRMIGSTTEDGDRDPPEPLLVFDLFEVRGGSLVALEEAPAPPARPRRAAPGIERIARLDTVTDDDLIVEGSICASDGDQCEDGETFLTPDVVNAQLKLEDTDPLLWLADTTAGDDDWVLRAQGGNLRIRNVDTGNDAIFIEEGVGDSALFIDSSGRIGLRTADPQDRLHLVHTDPTIRLTESDGDGADFRLRVDTSGGARSFAIRDAETFAPFLVIDQDTGRVGLGTGTPTASLDIAPRDGNAELRLASATGTWTLASRGQVMTVSREGSADEELTIPPHHDAAGPTLLVRGAVQGTQCVNTSSREIKTGFAALDAAAVLADLSALPVSTWRYRHEPEGTRHIGPMAEDFQELFGLGDGETISTVDAVGVLMAAVQALAEENRDLADRLAELEHLLRPTSRSRSPDLERARDAPPTKEPRR